MDLSPGVWKEKNLFSIYFSIPKSVKLHCFRIKMFSPFHICTLSCIETTHRTHRTYSVPVQWIILCSKFHWELSTKHEMNQLSSRVSARKGFSQILTMSKIQRFPYMLTEGVPKLLFCWRFQHFHMAPDLVTLSKMRFLIFGNGA